MKSLIISTLLGLFLIHPLLAGTYSDSLGLFQFETAEKLPWKLDDTNDESGLGLGLAKNSKGGIYMLTAIDTSKLEWDLETYPDSLIESFEKGDEYKKVKDVTKAFDDGTKKRYIEVSYSMEGKKVKAWLICAEKDDRLAVVMISCNRNGVAIDKKDPPKVLLSLKAK